MRCRVQFFGEYVHETVEDWALSGTWVLDEIRLAIQKGYEVIDILRFTNTELRNTTRARVRAVYL